MFRPVWILPRRWTSKVRSVTSTTSAAFTACTAEITRPRWSVLLHSTVISRSVRSPRASTVSTATIDPPARVMAAVTLPSTPPGREGSATRRISENCADGVATVRGSYERPLPLADDSTEEPRVGRFMPPGGGKSRPTRHGGAPVASIGLIRAPRGVEGAVPHRREQPRLSRLFCPPGVHRDLQGAAHERDLRLRLDAREDHLRVRREAHAGGLGRRDVGAQGGLRGVQGTAR